jgi:septum site-determining protein MinC
VTDAVAAPAADQTVDCGEASEFFQIRGQLYTLITLRVMEPDHHQFFMALHKEIGRSPDFYRHAPVVIDVGPIVERTPINLAEFGRRLRQLQLVPVGLQNGNDAWNQMAINAGFGLFPSGRPTSGAGQAIPVDDGPRPAPRQAPPRAETVRVAPPAGRTVVVSEPVRAGQQIYAKNADLVALAPVRPGAELMADGNIHIYSSLQGRAHAGVAGDTTARIFCHSREAQLISIAGIYLVNEQIDEHFLGRRVQVCCQNDTIVMSSLP